MDPSSLTSDQTFKPPALDMQSQPLDFQESPKTAILNGYHQNPEVYMHAFSLLPHMIEDMIILNNSNELF